MRKNLTKSIIACAAFAALSGCDVGGQTTQFNSDSVTVRTTQTGPRAGARAVAKKEADRVCATRGLLSEYQSTSVIPGTNKEEHFYLCV